MPDIGNTAKNQTHNLTEKTDKYVIIKCDNIIGKLLGVTGTCMRSTSQIRQSKKASGGSDVKRTLESWVGLAR